MASKASDKTFSAEVMATLLAALSTSGATVGARHYEIMAKLDSTKSASGWEHAFRPIKKRAKEISDQIAKGDFGDLDATPSKAAAGTKKATPAKRGRKAKAEDDGDDEETPVKKVKKQEDESDGGADGAAEESS